MCISKCTSCQGDPEIGIIKIKHRLFILVFMKHLTDADIESLYKEFQTPPHVRAHCRGVTDCAMKLAQALKDAGKFDPDFALLYGAGMIHDMARKYDHHEIVAADRLTELGFDLEADIVRGHMRIMTYHEIEHITEADLLYISDRMVLEDTFVGVQKRFDYLREKMARKGWDPDSEIVRNNRRRAEVFVAAIEAATGRSVFEICG